MGVPGENLLVQSREPTNSTHDAESRNRNQGHIGGRRVLSSLHPQTKKSWKCHCYLLKFIKTESSETILMDVKSQSIAELILFFE